MWKTVSRILALTLCLAFGVALAAGNTATITFTAPTTRLDGSAITGALTYNVYQGASGAEVRVQSGLTSSPIVISTGLADGTTVCWQLTAIEAGNTAGESPRTNEVCKTFPASPPASPSNVVVN